jgi:hypothetical protein
MDPVFAPSEIETWPIDRLRPYARNAKIHGDDQVAKIAACMAKLGWTVPCMVADDGELIAGHGRVTSTRVRCQILRCWQSGWLQGTWHCQRMSLSSTRHWKASMRCWGQAHDRP